MDLKFTFEDGSEAIAHYGVKGMKWGKHKKQFSDEELAELGLSPNMTKEQALKKVTMSNKLFAKQANAAGERIAKKGGTGSVFERVGNIVTGAKYEVNAAKSLPSRIEKKFERARNRRLTAPSSRAIAPDSNGHRLAPMPTMARRVARRNVPMRVDVHKI